MDSDHNKNFFFQHDTAIVETKSIGRGTRVWAYSHVLKGATIGADCNICDQVFIENDVLIGDRVTIKSGVQLWDGVRLSDDVFIGPNATFTNDLFPRSKEYPEIFLETLVDEGASIGANATILAGIKIGQRAMIGAGSVVTRDVPAYAVVVGNPAQIVRYVATSAERAQSRLPTQEIISEPKELTVEGCLLWPLPNYRDMRGDLTAIEYESDLPFRPTRSFFVYSVPNRKVRGEHAHRECSQFLIAAHGSLNVVVDNGTHREEVMLESPDKGLLIPPRVWGTQYRFSKDAVLCVFASHPYDSNDYIRDYGEFLALRNST